MKRLSIVLALALMAVLTFAAVSFAQESDGDTAAPETPTAPGWQMRAPEGRSGFFGRMAENMRERMMPQMMRQGRMHSGPMGPGMMGRDMMGKGMMGAGMMDREAHLAAVAEALGMSVEELDEAVTGGTPIHELAEAAGVDLHAVMSGLMAERIQAAVEAGDLTQEQADAMLERMESHPGPMMHERSQGRFENRGPGKHNNHRMPGFRGR